MSNVEGRAGRIISASLRRSKSELATPEGVDMDVKNQGQVLSALISQPLVWFSNMQKQVEVCKSYSVIDKE